MNELAETPAERASRIALERMFDALENGRSFRLEAGAGAGKTYSLVKALKWLIANYERNFLRNGQQIACITFTNVAKDEIAARVDRHPLIMCETSHAFCWSLISPFQKKLRELVVALPAWQEKLQAAEVSDLGQRRVEYSLGHRSIRDEHVTLHHDDVLPLTIQLMALEKFRRRVAQLFPIILVDEYQDTDANWIEAIKLHFLGQKNAPLFGFFGDHWQKIYGEGCGGLDHDSLDVIGKEANFRSVATIVDVLNRMRPQLPQAVTDPESRGVVRVFHTNGWPGERRRGAHWAGDLQSDAAQEALQRVMQNLREEGWNLDPPVTKILMLTHRTLATQQGYSSLPTVFRFSRDFAKKENVYIAYLVDVLEPACEAYAARKFGAMFEALGSDSPRIRGAGDKRSWACAMDELLSLRANGTVGDVVDYLRNTRMPRLPDAVEDREREIDRARSAGLELEPAQAEIVQLKSVPYSEICALRRYLIGHSPFETKHGVKGAEFENVVVVVGRGWAEYNFGSMLELMCAGDVPASKREAFERNRNLFYVACSRPKQRLALLFTQELSREALATVNSWFGCEVVDVLH